jgi:AraC family transcriptional regulator
MVPPLAHPRYTTRINRVMDHIDAHLGETLDLAALAEVAELSPFHFHRLFQGLTGETLANRVRRRRLEVAAGRLLTAPEATALAIALDVGFNSAEAFSRAFRSHFGITPTAWRRGGYHAWAERHCVALSKIRQGDRKAYQAVMDAFLQDRELWPTGHVPRPKGEATMDVSIKTLPDTKVAYMRHVGPYGGSGIAAAWQRFAGWCAEAGLMKPRRQMYGVCLDDPTITPPDKCRYDCAVEVSPDFVPTGEIGVETVAGGRYACGRFTGVAAEVRDAWNELVVGWLPKSGYQPDDRPAVEIYEPDFVVDEKTGAFSCLLCMPVRRL